MRVYVQLVAFNFAKFSEMVYKNKFIEFEYGKCYVLAFLQKILLP